jgi:hypothetical protein
VKRWRSCGNKTLEQPKAQATKRRPAGQQNARSQ